jgi:hypothetical protein
MSRIMTDNATSDCFRAAHGTKEKANLEIEVEDWTASLFAGLLDKSEGVNNTVRTWPRRNSPSWPDASSGSHQDPSEKRYGAKT